MGSFKKWQEDGSHKKKPVKHSKMQSSESNHKATKYKNYEYYDEE